MKRVVLATSFLVACGSSGTGSPPSPAPAASSSPSPSVPAKVQLIVELTGTAALRSDPPGIDCPGTCAASFDAGAAITLAVEPAEGWRLDAWSGACSGKGACEITLDAETKVSAKASLIDPRWDPAVGARDCVDAWGAAGEKLSPCDKTPDDYVVVHKSKRNVALCRAGKLVKNYRSGLGFTPAGTKQKQGDGRTPEGVFFIPRLVPNSSYYKAFLFSYPTKADAARGVAEGLISAAEKSQIDSAHDGCTEPPQSTGLGGAIEIHGEGSSEDWTNGCVALDNDGIDALWGALQAGDSIVVLP